MIGYKIVFRTESIRRCHSASNPFDGKVFIPERFKVHKIWIQRRITRESRRWRRCR